MARKSNDEDIHSSSNFKSDIDEKKEAILLQDVLKVNKNMHFLMEEYNIAYVTVYPGPERLCLFQVRRNSVANCNSIHF